jgi:hypothetical protein
VNHFLAAGSDYWGLPRLFCFEKKPATLKTKKSSDKPFETITHRLYSKSRIQLQERPYGSEGRGPLLSISTLNIP